MLTSPQKLVLVLWHVKHEPKFMSIIHCRLGALTRAVPDSTLTDHHELVTTLTTPVAKHSLGQAHCPMSEMSELSTVLMHNTDAVIAVVGSYGTMQAQVWFHELQQFPKPETTDLASIQIGSSAIVTKLQLAAELSMTSIH